MRTIGIIAALDNEIAFLKSKVEIKVTKCVLETEFYMGSVFGKSVVIVKCGVGKVNAAICAQVLIDLFAVDCIVNIGVAGGVYRDINIGDLVISTDAVQHDFDCTGFAPGAQIGEIPYMNMRCFPADEGLVALAKKAADELAFEKERNVYLARVATGDCFVSSKEKKKEIWSTTGGYCTEMEGAAIAQTCYLNKIPFVIIRTISDNADNTGGADFSDFLNKSAKISGRLAEKIIEYAD